MSTEIRRMKEILPGRRAPTQRAVLRSLLGGCSRAPEIAVELGLTTNAVSAALSHLARSGAVERVGWGRYRVRETMVALALLQRVEKLERRSRERRGAFRSRPGRPRSTSRAASTPAPRGGPI